jgi:hypothetical protein
MPRFACQNTADLFPANPLFFIQAWQLADRCNYSLAWTSFRADGLHQRPVSVLISIDFLAVPPKVHDNNYEPYVEQLQGAFLHYICFSE